MQTLHSVYYHQWGDWEAGRVPYLQRTSTQHQIMIKIFGMD